MALRLARWWVVLLGGVLLGMGILLHAQVTTMFQMRDEVGSTFFLWRALGQLTFVWQDDLTKAAIWANECPEPVLRESRRAALTMMLLGALFCVGSAFIRKPRKRG
jgi:hypothetical protein